MLSDNHLQLNGNILAEKRIGPPDRRNTVTDKNIMDGERRVGLPDRRVVTDGRIVHVVTGSGEYRGTVNLHSASEKVDRVSDFFIKSDISFLTLYDTTLMGQTGRVNFISIQDIALVIPQDDIFPKKPELRLDADISIKMKSGLGQIKGKINLLGENRPVDRISDLLNYPGKRWLIVYMASYNGKLINAAVINLDFISCVEDM